MGKVNKSLKAWVAFVKSVQKKYKLNYKDAISKAKVLKDKGADWMSNSFKQSKKMKGGQENGDDTVDVDNVDDEDDEMTGGRRRRRRTRKHRSKSRGRSRALKRTMSRRKSASRKASRSVGVA